MGLRGRLLTAGLAHQIVDAAAGAVEGAPGGVHPLERRRPVPEFLGRGGGGEGVRGTAGGGGTWRDRQT